MKQIQKLSLAVVGAGLLIGASNAATLVFNVTLDTGQEVPTPTVTGFTPGGSATVTLDDQTGAITVAGVYTGMTSGVSGSHLHGFAAAGSTAGVLIVLANDGGTDGNFSGSGSVTMAQIPDVVDGLTYLNIHTANNGSGEIRGQLVDPVPEPSSALLAGLSLFALLGRRARK